MKLNKGEKHSLKTRIKFQSRFKKRSTNTPSTAVTKFNFQSVN